MATIDSQKLSTETTDDILVSDLEKLTISTPASFVINTIAYVDDTYYNFSSDDSDDESIEGTTFPDYFK